MGAQLGVVAQGVGGPQVHHRLEDVLIQPGGGLQVARLGDGLLQQLDVHLQLLDLGLAGLGLAVPVDQRHLLALAHLLPLGQGDLQNAVLGGEQQSVPHHQAVRNDAVVGGVGVDLGGAVGLV